MSDDLALFGSDAPDPQEPPELGVSPIAAWQVDLLRRALDARGLVDMGERQQAIEAAAGRSVSSLRDLSHEEALSVLSRLGKAPAASDSGKSAWDDRGEDTWIDRL